MVVVGPGPGGLCRREVQFVTAPKLLPDPTHNEGERRKPKDPTEATPRGSCFPPKVKFLHVEMVFTATSIITAQKSTRGR